MWRYDQLTRVSLFSVACHLPVFPCVLSRFDTCHSLGDPHVVSFFVHVSCAYWSTCHFRVAARGTLWMFHVSFFESYMCRFLLVPRVIFIQLHVVLSSQNHFVIELFSRLVLAGASLIFIIPFQPSQLFQHSRPNGQHSFTEEMMR